MIIAATGHRPNKTGGYGPGPTEALDRLARAALDLLQPESVIVGMALGWDTSVGWAAVSLGIPVHAAIPFPGQESRWPAQSQRNYRSLLACCASVAEVSPGPYSAQLMQIRNGWMVDQCPAVLALWEGSAAGTGNCVRYATERRVPIINVWSLQ